MGYSFGQPPLGISGAGPTVGPPESSRSGLGCWLGFGERVGSGVAGAGVSGLGVGDALAVAVALAVGEAPAVGEAVPAAASAAPAQLSTVTVYGLSGLSPNNTMKYVPGVLLIL